MNGLWQDVVHGARLLRRYPSYALTAVLALGLGIGATTAIFSIVDATLLRDLPYPEPDRLVMVWEQNLERGFPRMDAAPPNFRDWRDLSESFEALGAFTTDRHAVSAGETATAVYGAEVTADVFEAIGVPPRLGRSIDETDLVQGGPSVVVLGDGVWTAQFGADPDVVGRTVEIDGEPATVIGVMPPGFAFPPVIQESGPAIGGSDVWLPLRLGPGLNRGSHFLEVVGRLGEEATVASAEEEVRTIAAQLAREYPDSNDGWSATVVPLDDQLAGQSRDQLAFLLGAVGLVLVIACINVANLLLARGTTRRQEIAVRAATGASRGRLVRQFLVESTILGLVGGAVGVAIARLGLRGLIGLAPETVLRAAEATLDLRVLGFTFLVSVASAILFGLLPAWSNASLDLSSHLREGGRGETGARGARRFQAAFITGEIALSLALLVGAGLLFQTFLRLKSADSGLQPERTVTATVALPRSRYGDDRSRARAYAELGRRVAALPEVEAAGFIWDVPLSGDRQGTQLTLAGETEPPEGENRGIGFSIVTSGYFDAMGVPVLRGRDFSSADLPDGEPVVIVNQALADRYFEEEEPIGRTVGIFGTQRSIVGVVGNVRFQSLREDAPPTAYLFFEQQPWGGDLSIAVRSRTVAQGAVDAVRSEVRRFDAAIPVFDVTAMTTVLGNAVQRERFSATLMGIFSALALVLAGVGVFGVVSYAVSRRVRETGIRIALGARSEDVLKLLVGQSMRPVLIGVAIGLPAAAAVAALLRSGLYGVGPADPVTFLGVLSVLLGVSFVATWIPARRATRVDPATALRSD